MSSRPTTPSASPGCRPPGWRSRERRSPSARSASSAGSEGNDGRPSSYLSDVAALTRKDLLLELRAKETVPAMLLFVLSALTIFHFATPATPNDAAAVAAGEKAAFGLLWTAIIFTALLGLTRAFVPEREQGLLDALVLAPCDRSAIWVAKSLSVLAFLGLAEVVAIPAFSTLFHGVGWRTVAGVALADVGICAVGTLTGAMAVAGRARELLLPLLFLPLAIPIVVGGVGASVDPSAGKYLGFLALYDAIFVLLSWAAFEYVVSET